MENSVSAVLHGHEPAKVREERQHSQRWRTVVCAAVLLAGAALAVSMAVRGAAYHGPGARETLVVSSSRPADSSGRTGAKTPAAMSKEQLQLGNLQPRDPNSPFEWDVPEWVTGDNFDYSTISKSDMIDNIEESMIAGLPREAFISHLEKELPADVAQSCDFNVDPCTNFYEFACGSWIKDTVIPEHEGKVLKSWGLTDKKVKSELRSIYEEPHAEPEFERLNMWYQSCMDTEQVDRVGLSDVNRVLAHVRSATSTASLQDTLAYLAVLNLQTVFTFKVNLPAGEHDSYSLYLKPAGLTMASPAIYLRDNADNSQLLADLHRHFIRLNQLSGLTPEAAGTVADLTIEMETVLAKFTAEVPIPSQALNPTPNPKPQTLNPKP